MRTEYEYLQAGITGVTGGTGGTGVTGVTGDVNVITIGMEVSSADTSGIVGVSPASRIEGYVGGERVATPVICAATASAFSALEVAL